MLLPSLSLLAATTLLGQEPRAEEPVRPWTLLVYGAADNNADGPILEFLDGVRTALDDDPGMEIILFIDRSEEFSDDAEFLGENFAGARVYRLRSDSAELLDASEFFPGMVAGEEYEVNSADPENVANFIAFGKQEFPARNYGMMIYSHADGCTMCPDEESGYSMNIPELTDFVDESASVDFLALELCNMAGIEIAYQWRPDNGGFSSDVLVAIPNAGPPLDWDRAFARIRSNGHATKATGSTLDPATMTALQFGSLVVEEGFNGRKEVLKSHPEFSERLQFEAAACYDLRKAEAAKFAVDDFAVALAKTDSKEVLERLRGPGDEGTVMNYVNGNFESRPYVDLTDLLKRAASCEDLGADAREAAGLARKAVDDLVVASFGMPGLEGFVPGENGIFIVFPDGDAEVMGHFGTTRVWSELAWYSPLAAAEEGAEYGRWAFLEDGATPGNGEVENWFELLDSWFDDTSSGPEGLNRYRW